MKMPKRFATLALTLALSACGSSPLPAISTASPASQSLPTGLPSAAVTQPSIESPQPSATKLPTLTPTLGAGSTMTSSADGMVLRYVPAGGFLMGSSDSDGMAYPDEKPQHSVTLDAFWIDQTEVTNGKYGLCVKAKACQPPTKFSSNVHDHYYGNAEYADFPVIYVNWIDAQAYCRWAGRRLPTEAEWEKAARGTDSRVYPWGNNPPDGTLLNFNNMIRDIAKTGNYPGGASPYGALDMAGNVWEWVADWYSLDYYARSPASNPTGPASGTQRVLRGGSWHYDAAGVRSAYRFQKEPTFSSYEIGFRCASSTAP